MNGKDSKAMNDPAKISFGDNVKDRIRSAAAGFRKKKAGEIKQVPGATHFCAWRSKAAMEIWLFCQQNNIPQTEYIIEHAKLHGQDPDPSLFDEPGTDQINRDGSIPLTILNYYQTTISGKETCKICWNTRFAYTVRGILLNDKMMPGQLGRVVCWCKRMKQGGGR